MLLKLLVLMLISSSFAATTRKLPLWEAGAGILPFRADNYRGSPQNNWYLFPVPAFTYRGKEVEAESSYVRGHLYKGDKFVFDASVSAGLNVNSNSNRLRYGMRDLDPTVEIGPMFRYYLWKSKSDLYFLNFEMPYRAVYATNLRYVDHVGYYSIPYLNFLSKPSEDTWGWSSEISIGIQYGSSGFHNRFYAVESEDVTSERRKFHSVAGYSGTQFAIILSKRFGNFLWSPFFRYDYLDGAVYNKSPLYSNPNYTMFGLNVMWFFYHSKDYQTAPTMVK